MISRRLILTYLLSLTVLSGTFFGEKSLTDPHAILEKHFEAIGGLENLKAMKTMYQEGAIVIEGAGLEGTFKQWSERPLRLRQETDLKIVSEVSGDNGEVSWVVDANGKVLIKRDENTLKEREVRKLMEEYEYMNSESEFFTLTFEGVEKVNGKDCYVVKIANTINQDVQINFYNKSNFYLLRTMIIKPDNEDHITYSDFRTVDGMTFPFREKVKTLPTGETTTVEYAKYAFNVEIDNSLFEPPQEDVEDFVFMKGDNAEDVPVEFIESHIYLPVNVLGKERLWVLDCGASVNVIDSSFAAELNLQFEGPIKGQGASGVVNFYFVTLPAYTVGSIQFREQKVLALSFREIFQRALGLDVIGILGYDFLSRFVTKIDYAKQTLSFYHPSKFEYHGNGKVIDSPIEGSMFSLPLTVDGEYSGKWRLDIGAPDIDFHYPYTKANDLLNREGVDVIVGDAAGWTKSRISRFRTIEIDGFILENPLIGMPSQEGTGSFAEESMIGNVGNSFLRNFVLYMDYSDQKVILEKGDDFGKEFQRGKSGLQYLYNADNDVEVQFVSPNTPADDAGFKERDIITSINGIEVQYLDGVIALRKLMRAEAGTTYTIGILREGKTFDKQLTLRDLF
ncbi:hypothetical protein AMJ83_07010 [candidate division WOR_3 bacterium SM23_42]|uniref:PDZ domain-containing protein n=1 Tax=candidate division WOR_3 bacterium SM23_42 TaxID=1703779 RepID=A0A0S8FTY3_UNCW3|nr:MAG: hypothetical protein AMJ83_07010 [candidate division WOR_3 bacterium SM23_42]